ncbi:MAG: ABC transporter ATP-binding protein [Actinomycetes bacterium]|jgi:ABC-2 type transport system ATP-binding protein|nr:ABC transporter ATP-binding protein [Actinomycetes bacterium]
MIQASDLTKRFGTAVALDSLTCQVPEGVIYGLVGSNGAGKSTFLRLAAGVYRPDGGTLTVDGAAIWENPAIKEQIAFVPDELYFLPQASLERMSYTYADNFPDFSRERYTELVQTFQLDPRANLNTFSKGMRRQAAIILALSRRPRYLLLDEVFDGLDPIVRTLVRRLIYRDVMDRGASAIISSHSLRELEDTCDQLALLHKGGIVFESDMGDLQTSLIKLQVAFGPECAADFTEEPFTTLGLDVVDFNRMGRVATLIVRGTATDATARLAALNPAPVLVEVLPLSLEEVFLYEMEAIGYRFGDVLESPQTPQAPQSQEVAS